MDLTIHLGTRYKRTNTFMVSKWPNYKVPKRETTCGLIYFSKRTNIFLNVFVKHVKNTNAKDTALSGKKIETAGFF